MTGRLAHLQRILAHSPGRMEALRALRAVDAPQGMIGAGYIRAAVWDEVCGLPPTPVTDIDVLFYDAGNLSRERELDLERRLHDILPHLPWSARNQARMHERNGDRPYRSVEDALSFWLETPTCVAVRLERDDTLAILAPFGLEDLFSLRIAPTPAGARRAGDYATRVRAKNWHRAWPGVSIVWP
jgi:uncharacterized protein